MIQDETVGKAILDHMDGCEIHWKPNKNLTVQKVKQKASKGHRGGKMKATRGGRRGMKEEEVWVEKPKHSFFQFFATEPVLELMEQDEEDEANENDLMEGAMERDCEIGLEIIEKIIPYAVLFFTGEYDNDDEGIDDDFGMEDEEGEFDENEEEDDDDEAHDFQPPEGAECKQQ